METIWNRVRKRIMSKFKVYPQHIVVKLNTQIKYLKKVNSSNLQAYNDLLVDNTFTFSNQQLHNWANKVMRRSHNCKACNTLNNLTAHHILNKSDYPQLALDVSNGITLCKTCHEELHRTFVVPNFVDLLLFINKKKENKCVE
jgi:5-methylcytosine-specific restriction endonuclease McrA